MEVKQSLRKSLQGISTSSQDIKLRNAAFILSTCGSVMCLHVLPSFCISWNIGHLQVEAGAN